MSEITIADAAQYASNKKSQIYGIVMGTVIPLCLLAEFNSSHDRNLPEILNDKQATTLCLQESFETTPVTEAGFQINLSNADIEACATSKVERSEQIQQAYIAEKAETAWIPVTLAGLFSAACLALAGHGFAANRRLRREKPGIEKTTPPNRFAALRQEL